MFILRAGTLALGELDDAGQARDLGLRLERVEGGLTALEYLDIYDYDLLLLDLYLVDAKASHLIRRVRAAGLGLPTVVLAVAASPQVRILALDQGADDVVDTPCHAGELLARIRAVVRRGQGHATSVLRCGPVEVSLHRHQVLVNGARLMVSRREFGVLELLFLKRNVILNKGAFLDHLYTGMEEPEMKTIDVIICRLRKKLETAGVPHLIETVWGCGYILREPEPAVAWRPPTRGNRHDVTPGLARAGCRRAAARAGGTGFRSRRLRWGFRPGDR